MKARLRHAFQPLPLVVAAIIGALVLLVMVRRAPAAVLGAVIGIVVQVGLRLLGVS